MRRTVGSLALLAAAGSAAACSSTWHDGYTYRPAPASATARPGAEDDRTVRVLATVVGIRRADGAEGRPAEVEVRLRLENQTDEPARFDPDSLALVPSDLGPLPLSRTEPAPLPEAAPDGAASLTAWFALPPGAEPDERNFAGLDLRWIVVLGERRLPGSVGFARNDEDLYDEQAWGPWRSPWWDPWWGPYGRGWFEPDVIVVRPVRRPPRRR